MPGSKIAGFAYHDVTDEPWGSGLQRPAATAYKLSPAAFGRHLDAIAGVSLRPELVMTIDPAIPGRHLLLTFDDGGKSALYASDELCRRGWLGHFFIITDRIGERTFLDAAEIRQLRQCGHVIGSHSHTHPSFFREQAPHQMMAEWVTSCDHLANLLGEPCTVASVPGGDISPVVLASAGAAGLRYLLTSEPTLVPRPVGGCWVLGRFCPKVTTHPSRVGELAGFRGWERALFIQRLKVRLKMLARVMLPGPYRHYVQRRTRETRASGGARQPVAEGR